MKLVLASVLWVPAVQHSCILVCFVGLQKLTAVVTPTVCCRNAACRVEQCTLDWDREYDLWSKHFAVQHLVCLQKRGALFVEYIILSVLRDTMSQRCKIIYLMGNFEMGRCAFFIWILSQASEAIAVWRLSCFLLVWELCGSPRFLAGPMATFGFYCFSWGSMVYLWTHLDFLLTQYMWAGIPRFPAGPVSVCGFLSQFSTALIALYRLYS